MVLLALLELAFAAILLLFVITQIIVPLFRGTPFFPFFRNERKLVSDLERAREDLVEAGLEEQIELTKMEAQMHRQTRAGAPEDASKHQPQDGAKLQEQQGERK